MPKGDKFWRFRNLAGGEAELWIYGDIASTSWWGDEVTPKEFAEELAGLGAVSRITVRINSGGGDVFAAQTIGNLLEQNSAETLAQIDGLCASAATIIACHCNRVVAANDSTYMIHPVQIGISGYIGQEDMEKYLDALKKIRQNIISLYAKKTGRGQGAVAALMDATSWWTAAEAKENGFVDELVDDGENTAIENRGGVLFVNGIDMHLPFDRLPKRGAKDGGKGPETGRPEPVPEGRNEPVPAGNGGLENKNPGEPGEKKKEDGKMDEIKTLDALREQYPDLVAQAEQEAARNATEAERERIREIEDMALPGSEEITNAAKFEKPVSASDYAKEAVKRAKAKGAEYIRDAAGDSAGSGIPTVNNAQTQSAAPDEFLDAIRSVGAAGKK